MEDLNTYLNMLRSEHDEQQKEAHTRMMNGDDEGANTMWAYNAGLLHAIRTLEDGQLQGIL